MGKIKDRIGDIYGRLQVVAYVDVHHGNARWLCNCSCGNTHIVTGSNLGSGNVKSCGCLCKETTAKTGRAQRRDDSAFNSLLSSYRHNAKTRGYVFNVSCEAFKDITSQPCFYCGAEPERVFRNARRTSTYLYNGLDRVDNSKGYVLGNLVSCCAVCNQGKHTQTQDEFQAWIERVYEHTRKAA